MNGKALEHRCNINPQKYKCKPRLTLYNYALVQSPSNIVHANNNDNNMIIGKAANKNSCLMFKQYMLSARCRSTYFTHVNSYISHTRPITGRTPSLAEVNSS